MTSGVRAAIAAAVLLAASRALPEAGQGPSGTTQRKTAENDEFVGALAMYQDDDMVGGTPKDVARIATRYDQLVATNLGWDRAFAGVLTLDERLRAEDLVERKTATHPDAGLRALAERLLRQYGYATVAPPRPPDHDGWNGLSREERVAAASALLDQTPLDVWRARRMLAITLRMLETERSLLDVHTEVRRLLPGLAPPATHDE